MKHLFLVLALLMTGCSIVQPRVTVTNREELIVTSPQTTSVLDQALPGILAQSEQGEPEKAPADIAAVMTPPAPEVLVTTPATIGLNISNDDLHCMAQNLFHEAYGEGRKGMVAVGYVTLNRVESGQFRPTICGVVKQSAIIRKTGKRSCQFSWVCDRRSDAIPAKVREEVYALARDIISRSVKNPIGKAQFFHNPRLCKPFTSNRFVRVARIGQHDFYSVRRA